jgi:hypothetical protein
MIWKWRPLARLSLTAAAVLVQSVFGSLPASASVVPALTTIANPDHGTVGTTLNDTATLTGSNGAAGTITFKLYQPNGDVAVYREDVTVKADGTYPTANGGHAADMTGDWYWEVEYCPTTAGQSGCVSSDSEKVVITAQEQVQPVLTTIANPASGTVGTLLKDTANLTGSGGTPGTIIFKLFGPGNEGQVYTETVTVHQDGMYSTAGSFTADKVGTWHWSAEYCWAQGERSVASDCGEGSPQCVTSADEPVVVSQAQPAISTTANPTTGLVGATLKDTASLTGGYQPTGHITFTLYDQSNAAAYTETVTVNGNGNYSTATGHGAGVVGTWHWSAAYSGDVNNKEIASNKADEPVLISSGQGKVQPAISTNPGAGSQTVGSLLKDTATLSGGNSPTGHITFTLYDSNAGLAYTEIVSVSGNGQYSTMSGHIADMVGTWHWAAAYDGDGGNLPVSSNQADEAVVVDLAQPTISTTPSPTTLAGSGTLKDTATLGGGYHPNGSITFTLYDPTDNVAYTETAVVSGNGQYSTATGLSVNTLGTWHWAAAYGGDPNNKAVASNKADEPVTVTGSGGVLAETGSTSPAAALALFLMGFGLFAILGGAIARRRRES